MVKRDNPDMSNTDVSRLLGEMWRNASQKERAPYVDQEERERAIYKAEIKKFKDGQAMVDAASRTSHQSVQKMADGPPYHGFDQRGHRGSPSMYDTMGVDSFEEVPSKASLHQAYTSSFAPYRQPYSSRAGK
jgi:HMG (high mobility group) box